MRHRDHSIEGTEVRREKTMLERVQDYVGKAAIYEILPGTAAPSSLSIAEFATVSIEVTMALAAPISAKS
jgi:hypothetical protein